jgi:hypothetical protein
MNNTDKIDNNISDIPDKYYIIDFRRITDFKKHTFSGYQKTDVINALQKSILEQKIEEACHWSAEMLVSGYIMECWDKLILMNSKLINRANPSLPFYLWTRFSQIIQIILDTKYHGEKVLNLRNNQECRNHLADIVSIMCLSTKNKLISLPKITTEDFRLDYFEEKLEAKHIYLIDKVIKPNDPSEINVVINELAFQITERTGTFEKALYWLNWILEWEKLNVKKANGFYCATRVRKYIKPQCHNDIVWLIWDVIFQEATHRGDETLNKQLIGLFKLFKYGYTSASKRKKSPLITHSIQLLSFHKSIKWDTPISNNFRLIIQANANTNILYLDFKNKSKENYQSQTKEKGLEILTRNNYLVSDQKISQPSSTNKNQNQNNKNKNKISNDELAERMNKLDMLDKIFLERSKPKQSIIYNPDTYATGIKEYQNTLNTISNIQNTFLEKK